jgi:hypothetical protein
MHSTVEQFSALHHEIASLRLSGLKVSGLWRRRRDTEASSVAQLPTREKRAG